MCIFSFTAKSRNIPKSQLKIPGPRRLLKPLLPREPARQVPVLGSIVSPKADGSYQKPAVLPILFGFPNVLLIGGLLPGQWGSQLPKTVKGVPLKMLIKLLSCHPDTTCVRAPLPASHFWPLPIGRSHTLVIAKLCGMSNPLGARFIFTKACDWIFGVPELASTKLMLLLQV